MNAISKPMSHAMQTIFTLPRTLRAAAVAQEGASCLLCYEADWRCCHRSRVAEILGQRHGFTVQHLSVADLGG